MVQNSLESTINTFKYYKLLGEKAMKQIPEKELTWKFNGQSNSILTIVKHMSGNMISRFTDFLLTDGEKSWRNRDSEFNEEDPDKLRYKEMWDKGWNVLLNTLESLYENDLNKIVYIRNEGHTVYEAIQRQLAHYAYHIGQIVFISKMKVGDEWESLSIPKNQSVEFNKKRQIGISLMV